MKQINGWYWPDCDEKCHPVVPRQVGDLQKALPLVRKDKIVAVQAGGNVGIWPHELAKHFNEVYTFEPDHENFACLRANVKDENVFAYRAALGESVRMGALELPEHEKNNVGAYQLSSDGREGSVVVMSVDSLHLHGCDLMVLDTEGTEPLILEGAKRTLNQFRPVLMVEDKGLSEKYGAPKGWSDAIEGYTVADRVHRDVILIPEERI